MLGLWITIGKTHIKNSKIKFPDKIFNETEGRSRLRKSSRSLIHRIITILGGASGVAVGVTSLGKWVVHLLVGTSQLTFLHTHWDRAREWGDRYIYMCDGNILFSLCCSFVGTVLSAWAAIQIPQTGWFKTQTFIFAQLRKLKGHDLGACKLDFSGEDLFWTSRGAPFHWALTSSALWASAPLCYLFLSLKDNNHVGLRFDS